MDSLVILIPIALLFTAAAVAAFFWAVNSGQYDDLDRAARDILFDDDKPAQQKSELVTGEPDADGKSLDNKP
jgi:cbb3-type cytochrome oxidase maturation protein